ncbi:22003_t:CDS:2 [Gigaspora margarita]|uniref:22003_t:CDS:1 n=1 Tax=Gigaspora margarita TaxID=4874 RepID=A0ABN7UNF2_GIGMA|nr:22003_t:CDS:2 [Gigaspora margarita]
MKLQNFYLIAIIICVSITFAPTIEAHAVDINLNLEACSCKIWVENSDHYRIGGDGSRHYHDCSSVMYGNNHHKRIDFQNVTFWLHAKVLGSLMQEKVRGPYNNNTCYEIHGSVGRWYFDEA